MAKCEGDSSGEDMISILIHSIDTVSDLRGGGGGGLSSTAEVMVYAWCISALKKRRESCLQLLDDGREGEIMPEGYPPFDYNLWRIMGHDID